jgi:VIT1/CCC1 family predicted Fe2+/Mn2+ transporter
VDEDLADKVAEQVSRQPDQGLALHVRQELGVDPADMPSPWVAAGASFASFTAGALVPLLPYLLGLSSLVLSLGLAAVAAVVGGGLVGRLTDRPVWRSAARQLLLGTLAAGATFLIGSLVGSSVG